MTELVDNQNEKFELIEDNWLLTYLQNNPQSTIPLEHYLIVNYINDFC